MRRFFGTVRLGIAAILVALAATSCRDQVESPVAPLDKMQTSTAAAVRLPAGSVDALAAALAAAGPHGHVVLESGLHTESQGIVIASPVKLEGEPGAVLQVDTSPGLVFPVELDVALLVRGASGTEIQGIEIVPADPIGGTAIAIQGSESVAIDANVIRRHQFSVIVHHGDHVQVRGNTVEASTAWMTGDIPEADGIVIVNAQHARVTDNQVSGGIFGIFTSDRDGIASNNRASGCFVGMILCKIPYATMVFPDGEVVGAYRTCTNWTYHGNEATGNLTAGILVIDEANRNLLVSNTGSNNGTYDIELAGDSMRFGFLTPTSSNNVVRVGNQPQLVLLDCGDGNQVHGKYNASSDACEVVP